MRQGLGAEQISSTNPFASHGYLLFGFFAVVADRSDTISGFDYSVSVLDFKVSRFVFVAEGFWVSFDGRGLLGSSSAATAATSFGGFVCGGG